MPLVEDASGHDLAGDESARGVADADQRVMVSAEDGVDRGHGVGSELVSLLLTRQPDFADFTSTMENVSPPIRVLAGLAKLVN